MTQFTPVPIGLVPRWVHDKRRLKDILDAMQRYEKAGYEIPEDWKVEYLELSLKLMEGGHIT